uniref:Uncharacterized protein n=1 Tax=Cryptomonas curvata TaxID=233186 RepID=A0A7S0M956_9CRYP|mmetsp:Transcript_29219/g.61354  ORF Transcript_29219/g.61354 Transcript_29219/m.61354 type:complete len:102 (+) Transcript_29219:35-340(+)
MECMLRVFPSPSLRRFDWPLQILISGVWQEQLVACTESILAFSDPHREKLVEVIPLCEIIGIQCMGGLHTADLDDDSGRIQLEITIIDRQYDRFVSNSLAH